MTFQPAVNEEILIDGVPYRIAEHPAAPGMPYGQEGRQAVVYQLVAGDERRALKVFKPRYRVPALAGLARRLAAFADRPGLTVCRRTVLTPQQHAALLRQQPDLTYAVLMPWITGPTWMEVLLDRRALSAEQSLTLARSLATVLAGMEQDGLAHCDLSGPNLLLPALASTFSATANAAELVDVEQMYSPDLSRPEVVPGGSPGYAHRTAPEGLSGSSADRFAGAVLLAEILGWCDERICLAAWGESYFEPPELAQDNQRADTLLAVLRIRWGGSVAGLFERTWHSETLALCPTFGEWLVALPEQVPEALTTDEVADHPTTVGPVPIAKPLSTLAAMQGTSGSVVGGENRATDEAQTAQEAALASLFGAGLAAYRAGDWARTRELLTEVVRQEPGYRRDGHRAVSLLAEAERRLEAPPPRPGRRLLVPTLVLLGFLAVVAAFIYQMQITSTAQAQATATAQAQTTTAAQATSTALALQTATAQAQTTGTAAALADIQATQTVQTVATMTSEAGAAITVQAQTTSTAEAAAQQATAVADMTHAAEAAATATARAQAAAVAAQASATAQAQADLAVQATAQAQADAAVQATAAVQAQAAAAARTAQAAQTRAAGQARAAQETAAAQAQAAAKQTSEAVQTQAAQEEIAQQTALAQATNAVRPQWVVGSIVGLCKGTQIRVAPALDACFHTVVPEDNWTVEVIGGPHNGDGRVWYDTSRHAVGDPSGGTGWVDVDQAVNCPALPEGGGAHCPPVP